MWQFSDKDPKFVWIPTCTSCLDVKIPTANDILAEQNASKEKIDELDDGKLGAQKCTQR